MGYLLVNSLEKDGHLAIFYIKDGLGGHCVQ